MQMQQIVTIILAVVFAGFGIAIALVVMLVVFELVTFQVAQLLFTIWPRHCRECGKRFTPERAYWAIKDGFVCVVCLVASRPKKDKGKEKQNLLAAFSTRK